MTMRVLLSAVCASAALAVSFTAPASAHHSFAIFDRSQRVTLVGTVKSVVWTNPHARIDLDVEPSSGEAVTWVISALSPNILERHGWKKSTLKVGDRVSVMVNPLRNGKPGGNLISVTLPDGKVMGGGA